MSKANSNQPRFKRRSSQQRGAGWIVAPNGKAVIQYWTCEWARLGSTREFNACFTGKKQTAIVTRYGGFLRELLAYLNTGSFPDKHDANNLYNGEKTLARLDELRRRHTHDH